ncbi:MAG TPA: glycosyltransferase, partial [Planctomycetaceae bacterium]|nr:glycosyltransferase [Planctomycetaceae bacterium]
MQTTIAAVGWMLFAVWAVVSGIPSLWMIGRSLKRQADRLPDPAEWPFVSVVVPARDEAHKIEAGLRSLLASDYPNFEVIAIDDRSRDETGAIMDRLAKGVGSLFQAASLNPRTPPDESRPEKDSRPRLNVIHITELPDDWLGKNHALHVGSRRASGEWILFTDGDVVHEPHTLRRAVRFAIARGIDHLPMYPDIEAAGYFEASFVARFGLIFAAGTQPWLI